MSLSVKTVLENSKTDPSSIACVGISNQRETVVAIDKQTGKPYGNAIVWQCKRTADMCLDIKKDKKLEAYIRKTTGLVVDPYFSGSKIRWLIENHKLQDKVKSGDVMFMTMDTFLLYKLTGQNMFATEASNASRTMLMDLQTGQYDEKLLELFGVTNVACLPKIKNSHDQFGQTNNSGMLPDGIAVTGILGDQQAALAGQACFKEGEAKCTFGTGAFVLVNKGSDVSPPPTGILNTVAWKINGKLTYASEGSCFIAGSAVQYIRDQLDWISSSQESETKASSEPASPDVIFVPALSGLGSPHWNPNAKGAFLGLTRGTHKSTLTRAAREGIAFQVNDLLDSIQSQTLTIKELAVDGGAAANNLLMQFQSDISQIKIRRPQSLESTSFGAAVFAAYGAGIIADLSEFSEALPMDREFVPNNEPDQLDLNKKQLEAWQRGVKAVSVFSKVETR